LKQRVTRQEIGLQRLPTWAEIGLAAVGYIASSIIAALVIFLVSSLAPGFDADQAQDVGFSNLVFRYEYIVAFLTLVVIAPVVEEIFFRGYLYSRLKKYIPTWVAIIIVSALFGIAHGQINIGIMTFVMSVFLCLLRDLTGSLWPSIVMHMIRNGVAFVILFILPMLSIN
jgi:membrane protease YdiL (CAAX protease family)